ncbi:MAG: tripartite tricarboxylate transporter substrate binding protein, partial [Burkholderiales bacterium]
MTSIVRTATLLTLFLASPAYAGEQSYPTRPVRIIASPVGTTSDLLSRQLAQRLNEMWGKTVIVDNRAGA